MKSIRNHHELAETIRILEFQRNENKNILKNSFYDAYESMQPINLVKYAIRDITESKEIKKHAVDYAIGLGSGFITKKIVQGLSPHPLKKILGTILQAGVTQFVYKNPDRIKSTGFGLIKILMPKKTNMKKISSIDRRIDDAFFIEL